MTIAINALIALFIGILSFVGGAVWAFLVGGAGRFSEYEKSAPVSNDEIYQMINGRK